MISFEEIFGIPLLFSWSILQPIITLLILNGAKILSRRSSRLAKAVETGSIKFWAQICAAILLLIITIVKNYVTRQPSFFGTENIMHCSDTSIKLKFKQFIKTNHPDKSGISTEDFGAKKSMYEILKDSHKCKNYDVFGLELGDVKKIPRTERENFDHYLVESGMFYAFCLVFFILIPFFNRTIDELSEPFLIIAGAYALELDGIFLHRNGSIGAILVAFSKLIRPMSVSEFRTLIRSYVMPTLVFINHIRPILHNTKPMSAEERREALKFIYSTLKKVKNSQDSLNAIEPPHTVS